MYSGSFLEQWANWREPRCVLLTFDVDWAPDFMIAPILELLDRYSVRATFFATHYSELLAGVAAEGRHEIGLHLYLGPDSTQGPGLESIFKSLIGFYPTARGTRFHILGHSYRDLIWLGRQGMSYDVSGFRFNCPYLLPAWHPDLDLTLLTYSWEDGPAEEAGQIMTIDSVSLDSPGMKIINFHPLNAYLDCPDLNSRKRFKAEHPDLLACSEKEAQPFRSVPGNGSGTILAALLKRVEKLGLKTPTISELVRAFLEDEK